MSRIMKKIVSVFLMIAIIFSAVSISVQADQSTVLKKVNVLQGKQPTTNSTYGGIKNKEAATDGVTNTSHDDSTNTEISAGRETGGDKNGYDSWTPVYLQYDFGKSVPVEEIKIYRNSFTTAVITFKKVKVELSQTEDFAQPEIVFAENDVTQTIATKRDPQVLKLQAPKEARYIRVWGQGQYIQNHVGSWKGYSNAVRFHEIEVIASVSEGGDNGTPSLPEEELHNIAKGKLPYVYGLEPSNIENISDGDWENTAVHNSRGNRWLQFEYKNQYRIKRVEFKLEPGEYHSVKISIGNNPTRDGHSQSENVIFQQNNFNQGTEKKVITLQQPVRGKVIRFLVNKSNNEPTGYSEIAIWSTTPLANEEKPEYREPTSQYNNLVWSDEFDGDEIDEEKWNIIEGMANHGAIYNRGAVSIVKEGENKYLSIRSKNYETTEALKNAVGYDEYDSTPLRPHVTWSSGRLESKNKFSFQYGRMATRAKVNDSRGIWPAIWMLCQDETGHDEIDVLEYLGQDAHGAWATNHYGIWGKNKASHGKEKINYEAWSQDFHVYEVEWNPQNIIWYIDGEEVFRTTQGKALDGMHSRPMFPILETQVGDGWVGKVDFSKQETKQDSQFLIDWIRVYQAENQPIARFDDLESITDGKKDKYRIPIHEASEGLTLLTHGERSYENKNNFFYGGQPRYEKNRIAVKENATGEQYIIYEVPGVKDVHLTAYYQTLPDKRTYRSHLNAGYSGHSIRETMLNGNDEINFVIYTSANGSTYRPFYGTKVVDNFIEVHPAYARTTFDAYNLPEDTRFVKIVFPQFEGKKYRKGSGQEMDVKNTDIQLAKVTFLQIPQDEESPSPQPQPQGDEHLKVFPSLREYQASTGNFEKTALRRMLIVDNELSRRNNRVKEAVQLVNQEFAAYGIPNNQTMPILFTDKAEAKDGDIVIELKNSIDGVAPAEGFTVHVDKKITIEAKNSNGVMYALRTIMQYMQLHNAMPYGMIKDYPDTDERALHLDMGRKYFTPDWIKRTIRELSFMRVNAIQLHFSEHEGYRLESETYPNLMSDRYVTKEQMREIIAEAKKYGVDIIPSFDNPGHLRAALRNYPQFQITKRNGAKDPGAIDINNDEARQFIKNILKEYAELFADSTYFHIGADEFIDFNKFYEYPSMAEFGRKRVGPNATGLDGYMAYINEIAEYVHGLGFRPRIWNDGVYRSNINYSVKLHDYIQVGYWTQWDRNMPSVQKLLQNNHELINVNDNMYYVLTTPGRAYDKKPNPEKIYREIDVLKFPDRAGYKPPRDKVKGLTYAIWCDVPDRETEAQVTEGMYYSLRAMAEKAWAGKQAKGEYNKFEQILNRLKGLSDPNKEMPQAQTVNYKQGLVEVLFKHNSNKNQVLGYTEMRVGESDTIYQYQAPEFKEFEYKSSSENLNDIFSTNKTITLHYEKITQLRELQNVIAEKLQEKDFVAESYAGYKSVMARAEALAQESNPSDTKITEILLEIKKAEAALVKIIFKELYVRLHNPKPEDEYTRLSYREYKMVVNELKEKIKGKDVEDGKLADFTAQLDAAEKQLKPRQGDTDPTDKREQLRLAIEEARAVKETAKYKNASKAKKDDFDEALRLAEQYYENDSTPDFVLALAANGLRNTTAKLDGKDDTPIVPPVDKEALKVQIAKATALENSEKFNHAGTEKQTEFTEALEEARKLEKDEAAKKEDVDKASERLKKATEAIEAVVVPEPEPEPADKEALRAEIAKATALENSEKFNHADTEKQKEFTEALEEARKLEKDEAAKKEDVDKASERLKKATEAIEAVVVPEPEPEPEPQPQPEPQPEVLLPYIPEVVEEPVKEEVIEEEEIALASPEELSKWTDGLEKATDKELVKRLLEQKATPEELVKHFSEEGLTQLAKQVSDVFVDEKAGTWYQKELAMAILLKLVNGYGDDTFRAENKVTGKELIAILLRAGKVTVEPNEVDWFMPYLEMAKKEKLLTEVNFDLNKELSREEVALLVYNFMMRNRSQRQLPNRMLQFQDKEEIATDLRNAVSYLYEKEILKGYEDESYRPKNSVKRSEVVAIIYRMLKNK
ncbi:MAG: family 20 glycosylhydrolase [Eubacteriales bacterium]|nr:family 20 glycosylhydrolase [Eubacteriales bacterium]